MNSAVTSAVHAAARAAKDAQPALARLHRGDKDQLLLAMAEALGARVEEIVAASARAVAGADGSWTPPARRGGAALDIEGVGKIAERVGAAAALPDAVGEVIRGSVLDNGLELREVRVSMGVIGMV